MGENIRDKRGITAYSAPDSVIMVPNSAYDRAPV